MFFKIMALALIGVPATAGAQDFEDDIYYNPSKSTKQTVKVQQKTVSIDKNQYNDWMSSDSYSYASGSTRDVDEYNRRYNFADTVAVDSVATDDFTYTRRIQKFYNPEVVEALGDQDLIDLYYSSDDNPTINVYNINTWGGYPYSSYYWPYSSWAWNYWGPSWSISFGSPWWGGWGYNPWWGFDPFWSWSWGWGPSFGPAWGHGWGHGGGMAWHPATTSPGASRPHGYAGAGSANGRYGSRGGSYTPSGAAVAGNRPGNMGRGRNGSSSTKASQPAAFSPGSWSASESSSSSSGRGRINGNSSSSKSDRNKNYNSSSNSNSNSSNSYRSSGSSTRSSGYSGGSYSGGRGAGSHGGGNYGGGGGGRGRR